MKKSLNIFCIFMIGEFLMSCSEPIHSVEWYKQHEVERKIKLNKCKANGDLMTKDQNCQNAASAEFRSGNFTKSLPKTWGIEDGVR